MHTLEQLQAGALAGTTHLKLSCGLRHFPREILTLADTLEILDLSGNELCSLPSEFALLSRLKIVFLSNNPFTEFPSVLGRCHSLKMIGFKACRIETVPENAIPASCRWLILTDNKITRLPASIGRCTRMQKLMLAGNQLDELPPELAHCQNLQLLRISANNLAVLPDWLFSLPNLAWLAFAGNPCSATTAAQSQVLATSWKELVIENQIGEGASGIIYKTHVKPGAANGLPDEVAVKIFKGAITSDGLPEDEIKACVVAGMHPNLVETLSILSHHPEQKQGLLMGLIPDGYKNLGGPPSFATITRDTFAAGTNFTLTQVLAILKGISSVACHLHEKGILHGDVYAHNTLINEEANPLFGDFGAATVYDRSNQNLAFALERIEVKAFGYLMDDLLQLVVTMPPMQEQTLQTLKGLRTHCLHPALEQRPSFSQIEKALITCS